MKLQLLLLLFLAIAAAQQDEVVRARRTLPSVVVRWSLHQQSTNSAAAKPQYRTARGAVIGHRSSSVSSKRGRARYMREWVGDYDDSTSRQINEVASNDHRDVKEIPLNKVNSENRVGQKLASNQGSSQVLGLFVRNGHEEEAIRSFLAAYAAGNGDAGGQVGDNLAISLGLPVIKITDGDTKAGYALYHQDSPIAETTTAPTVTKRPTILKKSPWQSKNQLIDDNPSYSATRYEFGYRVVDNKVGSDYGHEESRNDDAGSTDRVTSGRYHVLLPDGKLQRVRYYVDKDGYHAFVSYEKVKNQAEDSR